jgi:hypothetical protein
MRRQGGPDPGAQLMSELNYWKAAWSLDEAQCPCDLHFLEYLEQKQADGAVIFHFGTGNHHIVGRTLHAAGRNCAVLGITASPKEYDAYVALLIANPGLGRTYKAYFGDIYQIDPRLLPELDYAALFHVGEFRTAENDSYGALTDLEMTVTLADKIRPGGEVLFYKGSFAYDKAQAVAEQLVKVRPFATRGDYRSLAIFGKRAD